MNINDKLIDKYIKRDISLMRVEAYEIRKILTLLLKLEKEIKEELYKYQGFKYDLTAYRRKRLEKKLKSIKLIIKDTYKEILNIQKMSYLDLTSLEYKFAQSSLTSIIGISLETTAPSALLLKSVVNDTLILGSRIKDKWVIQANYLYSQCADQIRMGLLLSEPPAQLSRRIFPNVTGVARRNATTLARTSFHAIIQRARFEGYKEIDNVIKGYQWLSTLDSRTSLTCVGLSGLVWDKNYKPIGHSKRWRGSPPAHFNCRSTIVPVVKSYKELDIKNKKDIPESTRASMDGQAAADISYLDWLKNKSKKTQIEVLGVGRRKLWLDGKLSQRDLITQDHRPIKLKDLD